MRENDVQDAPAPSTVPARQAPPIPYALFEAFPRLAGALPRLPLGSWPTPLAPSPSLAAAAGLPFKLYVKRDDLSSSVYGGNKVRKLELILAGRRPGRLVVTSGGLGSNHVVATAALAGAAGLRTRGLLYCQPVSPHVRRNLLADLALGADLRFVRDYPGLVRGYLAAIAEGLAAGGRLPLLVMPGGSSPLSSVGYVNAVFELARQLEGLGEPEPAAIIAPAGTGGTVAGLLAGVVLAGWPTTIVAVRVVAPDILPEAKVRRLAARTLQRLVRLDPQVRRRLADGPGIAGPSGAMADLHWAEVGGRLVMDGGFLGEAYGFSTSEARRAVDLAARSAGLTLETTYTGKALAALLAAADVTGQASGAGRAGPRTGPRADRPRWLERARDGQPVVFLNTYSSVDPADLPVGALPEALVGKVPDEFRWCFDRTRPDCRCALARQNFRFCREVKARDDWQWEEPEGEARP